jgi:hypothetical protein
VQRFIRCRTWVLIEDFITIDIKASRAAWRAACLRQADALRLDF